MFFVDKYTPKKREDAIIHTKELAKLQKLSNDDSMPHMIFYGPKGSGKKTIINLFLEMIYGSDVNKLTDTIYSVSGSSNTVQQVVIKQSNYHIIIDPNNNNFDRYLIQDVVKEYAKKPPNLFISNKPFKIVLINNIDKLSYYAQTALRRMMEKYITCRFIMWSEYLSKVIDPLRSRCYCFRIQSPDNNDMFKILLNICGNENIKISFDDLLEIYDKSKGNIKNALWLLQIKKIGDKCNTTYDDILNQIMDNILSCDLENLQTIRDMFYNIMITNISGTDIIKDLVEKLMEHDDISFECKINIAEISAKYEHNLTRGRREIIHLDAFVNNIILCMVGYKYNIEK